jgi:uncharacterized protein (TIGR03086 family)
MPDLTAAASALARIIEKVDDDQLGRPTPCAGASVGDLLDHVQGLAIAFTLAARKQRPPEGAAGPSADASKLEENWRRRIPERLEDLAGAWSEPSAWTGMTSVGGQDLPGQVAGAVALDEVVIHGWDLAAATGQDYEPGADAVEVALGFVEPVVAGAPGGTPGLFGPPVPVAEDAGPFARLLGLTGRDPAWRPPPR